jgi:mannose-6-phosphate isomerase-like protein (cupin superfamily)
VQSTDAQTEPDNIAVNKRDRSPGAATTNRRKMNATDRNRDKKEAATMIEYVGPIEEQTLKNTYFRQVLFTGPHSQLVVMCLRPGEEIGDEVHPKSDQFFRIEKGEAKFVFNEKEEHKVHDGDAVVVPAGTYHNVINTSKTLELKLYTISLVSGKVLYEKSQVLSQE